MMVVVLGFMFQVTQPFSQLLVIPQHNETQQASNTSGWRRSSFFALKRRSAAEPRVLYTAGVRDLGGKTLYLSLIVKVKIRLKLRIIRAVTAAISSARSLFTTKFVVLVADEPRSTKRREKRFADTKIK